MAITSYAQNFEDVILWRALQDVGVGTYVDLGAQHPRSDSVSRAFYEQGWRGVHVEPVRHYADLLRNDRPDELVLEALASDKSGLHTFYEIPMSGLSTLSPEIAQEHEEKLGISPIAREVPAVTLAAILDEHVASEVHWLKIDVEGHEEAVLRSWGESQARPWIVLLEATYPNTQRPVYQEWEHHLFARDYDFVYEDGLNRFYLHRAQQHRAAHFHYGPSIFDAFSVLDHWSTQQLRSLHQQEVAALQLELEDTRRQAAEAGSLAPLLEELRGEYERSEEERSKLATEAASLSINLEEVRAELQQTENERSRLAWDLVEESRKAEEGVNVVRAQMLDLENRAAEERQREAASADRLAARLVEIEKRAAQERKDAADAFNRLTAHLIEVQAKAAQDRDSANYAVRLLETRTLEVEGRAADEIAQLRTLLAQADVRRTAEIAQFNDRLKEANVDRADYLARLQALVVSSQRAVQEMTALSAMLAETQDRLRESEHTRAEELEKRIFHERRAEQARVAAAADKEKLEQQLRVAVQQQEQANSRIEELEQSRAWRLARLIVPPRRR